MHCKFERGESLTIEKFLGGRGWWEFFSFLSIMETFVAKPEYKVRIMEYA